MKGFLLGTFLFSLLSSQLNAQTCRINIKQTTPTKRFEVVADGVVLDRVTGLQWMRCALGQTWDGISCNGPNATYTWGGALNAAENQTFAGQTDWRLPNVKELGSIVEQACIYPAINAEVFPRTSSERFWTSTPNAYTNSAARSVNFEFGSVGESGSKANFYRVRLVRSGPSGD
jgi:hypothetical protein